MGEGTGGGTGTPRPPGPPRSCPAERPVFPHPPPQTVFPAIHCWSLLQVLSSHGPSFNSRLDNVPQVCVCVGGRGVEYVSYGYHSANTTTKCSIPHRLKPQTDSNRGEETRERQIFCSVWRETSESASGNSDRRGGDPPGMVSVRSGRAVLCCF